MKKAILVLAILIVVSCMISIVLNQNQAAANGEQTENTSEQTTPSTTQTESPEETITEVKISTDEYFALVNAAIRNCVEPEGYIVSRTSTLRTPYYHVDCTANGIDTTNFKEDALRIAENIYNILLQHEYHRRNIFLPSHEIISLSFCVVANGETTHGLTIQFDLTDIDRSKPFLENLKTPITP